MRRRLDLAVSLIATPPVLFLDEPTTGLDPRSRVELWDVLRELVSRRHDPAADHAVPRGGRPAGRPDRRHRPRPGDRRGHAAAAQGPVRARPRWWSPCRTPRTCRGASGCCATHVDEVHVDAGARQLTAPADGLGRHDPDRRRSSTSSGIELDDLGLKRPSLDDVFLHLTGHRAEDADRTTSEELAS